MSDSGSRDTASTTSTTREDDKWTMVGSKPPSPAPTPEARSPILSLSNSSPLDETASEVKEDLTISNASPARSLVESEEGDSKLNAPTIPDDFPIATPPPPTPLAGDSDNEDGLETPKLSTPSESNVSNVNSQSDDETAKSIEGEGTRFDSEVPVEEDTTESATKDIEVPVPTLTVTKATLSASEVIFESAGNDESSLDKPAKEDEKSEKTTDAPSVKRIDTSFITNAKHLFESPTFTNHAAPNSAVSPKTASFFSTAGLRSPPRAGGCSIVELPSDADTADELRAVFPSRQPGSRKANEEEDGEEEEEEDEPEKPSSSSKTVPLISSNNSSDTPTERPPYSFGRQFVSTFSRDHSPAPTLRPRIDHRSRDRSRRFLKEEYPASPPPLRHTSSAPFRSRTYVSSGGAQPSRPPRSNDKDIVEAKLSMSIASIVDELKKALAEDSTAYYVLKGVLAEHEELRRGSSSASIIREPDSKKPPVSSERTDPIKPKTKSDGYVVKEEAKEEKLTPRRYRHSFKPPPPPRRVFLPVKSFSLTQTDTESETEGDRQRQKGPRAGVPREAHHGCCDPRAASPLTTQQAPPAPIQPSTSTKHASKPSFSYKDLKLVSPNREITGATTTVTTSVSTAANPPSSSVLDPSVPPPRKAVPGFHEEMQDFIRLVEERKALSELSGGKQQKSDTHSRLLNETNSILPPLVSSPQVTDHHHHRHSRRAPPPAPARQGHKNVSSSTSALRGRPDLRPSPSKPLVHVPSSSYSSQHRSGPPPPPSSAATPHYRVAFDPSTGKSVLLVNYLRPVQAAQVHPTLSGRKRRAEESDVPKESRHHREIRSGDGGKLGRGDRMERRRRRKGEREGSISFDFDDFP
ncbi:hypothetical protein JCM16303_001139 [Sporobolomyces ruberrimus]